MPILDTKLNARSADFQANANAMRVLVKDLDAQTARVALGGGDAARAKHTGRGKLLPRDRVQQLLDPGSPFLEFSALAAYEMYRNESPGAGIGRRGARGGHGTDGSHAVRAAASDHVADPDDGQDDCECQHGSDQEVHEADAGHQ